MAETERTLANRRERIVTNVVAQQSKEERIYRFLKRDAIDIAQDDFLDVNNLELVHEQMVKPLHYQNIKANREFDADEICCQMNVGYFLGASSSSVAQPFEQLGVSIVLYFRLVKSLIVFMVVAFLLELLSLYIFYRSSDYNSILRGDSGFKEGLFLLSVGTLGLNYNKCSFDTFKGSAAESFTLSCSSGQLQFQNIYYASLRQSLSCVNSNLDYTSKAVSLLPGVLQEINSKCDGQKSCSFKLYPQQFTNQQEQLYLRSNNYAHYAKAECRGVLFPLFNGVQFSGETIGFLLVAVDCLVMFAYIGLYISIKYAFKQTVKQFNSEVSSIERFSLQIPIHIRSKLDKHAILSKVIRKVEQRTNSYLDKENPGMKAVCDSLGIRAVRVQLLSYSTRMDSAQFTLEMDEQVRRLIALVQDVEKECGLAGLPIAETEEQAIAELFGEETKGTWEQIHRIIEDKNQQNSVDYLFLTFENAIERDAALKAFERTVPCERCRTHDRNLDLRGRRMDLEPGFTPQQISWHNLKNNDLLIGVRSCLLCLVAVVIFFGAYLFLAFLDYQQRTLSNDNFLGVDCASLSFQFQPGSPWNKDWADKNQYPGFVNCYCTAKILEAYSLAECSEWFQSYLKSNGLPVLFSVVVLVFNVALQFLLTVMTAWEGHKSEGRKLSSLMLKLFLLQFLNSGLLILLVNLKASNYAELENGSILDLIFGGRYSSFNSNWYLEIGYTLAISMLVNIASPITRLAVERTICALRRCWDHCGAAPSRQQSLTAYVELYSGPEFLLAEQCSFVLTIATIALFYGQAMPLSYLIAALCLLVQYWIDKYMLCRVYRRPKNYDSALMATTRSLLILPLLFHCLSGVLFLSSQAIFPEALTVNQLDDLANRLSQSSFFYFFRVVQIYPYIAIIIIVLLIKSFEATINWLISQVNPETFSYEPSECSLFNRLSGRQLQQLENKARSDLLALAHKDLPIEGGGFIRVIGNFQEIKLIKFQNGTRCELNSAEVRVYSEYLAHLLELIEKAESVRREYRTEQFGLIGEVCYERRLNHKETKRAEKLLIFETLVSNV